VCAAGVSKIRAIISTENAASLSLRGKDLIGLSGYLEAVVIFDQQAGVESEVVEKDMLFVDPRCSTWNCLVLIADPPSCSPHGLTNYRAGHAVGC
jgi:hypothetical protein